MKTSCVAFLFVAVFATSQAGTGILFKLSQFKTNQRIVNGQPADIADFPHHLGLFDLQRGGYQCGAVNIASLWAISAAHCLDSSTPPEFINLWGGSTSRLSGGIVFFVVQYINHPQYNSMNLNNDISVIRVDPSTPLTGTHIIPIALPPNCETACCSVCVAGSNTITTGWGMNESNVLPVNLQQVSKPIFDQAQCNSVWGIITPQMFCTAVIDRQDSCNADSGGPIIRDGVCVGLVSFGSSPCGGGPPAGAVRIEAPIIRNFIRQHTNV